MADSTHSLRCAILYTPIVGAVVLYLAVEVYTAAELCLIMSLCVFSNLMSSGV